MVADDINNDVKTIVAELAEILNKGFYRGNEQFKSSFFTCLDEKTGSHNLSAICEHIIVTKL